MQHTKIATQPGVLKSNISSPYWDLYSTSDYSRHEHFIFSSLPTCMEPRFQLL